MRIIGEFLSQSAWLEWLHCRKQSEREREREKSREREKKRSNLFEISFLSIIRDFISPLIIIFLSLDLPYQSFLSKSSKFFDRFTFRLSFLSGRQLQCVRHWSIRFSAFWSLWSAWHYQQVSHRITMNIQLSTVIGWMSISMKWRINLMLAPRNHASGNEHHHVDFGNERRANRCSLTKRTSIRFHSTSK